MTPFHTVRVKGAPTMMTEYAKQWSRWRTVALVLLVIATLALATRVIRTDRNPARCAPGLEFRSDVCVKVAP